MTVVPDNPAELLLVGPEQDAPAPLAGQSRPGACGLPGRTQPGGARRSGAAQTVVFESSRMLNVCPKLPEHEQGACSAVCVPVMFMGSRSACCTPSAGRRTARTTPRSNACRCSASETGNRLGTLRRPSGHPAAGRTDGLTGLVQPAHPRGQGRGSLMLDSQPFSIAMADLDHFKSLNDTHGHETGDRALRLFAPCSPAICAPATSAPGTGARSSSSCCRARRSAEAHARSERLQDRARTRRSPRPAASPSRRVGASPTAGQAPRSTRSSPWPTPRSTAPSGPGGTASWSTARRPPRPGATEADDAPAPSRTPPSARNHRLHRRCDMDLLQAHARPTGSPGESRTVIDPVSGSGRRRRSCRVEAGEQLFEPERELAVAVAAGQGRRPSPPSTG